MKKSVIFTIVVIYLLAIVLVGFMGQKLTVYDAKIDVQSITCESEGYVNYDPNNPKDVQWINDGYVGKISLRYEEGMRVLLKCRIYPADATEQKVQYISGNKTYGVISYNEDGTAYLDILKAGTFDVTIQATDHKKVSIKIKIIITETGGII